jgi:hypothetical protein
MPRNVTSTGTHIGAVLDQELGDALRARARQSGYSVSSIIRAAVKVYLARIEQIDAAIDMITCPAGEGSES